MYEQIPSQEQKNTAIESRFLESLRGYITSLEASGRRIIMILGPAMAIGDVAEAAEYEGFNIQTENTKELHCNIAYMNANGENTGSAVMHLPSLETLPKQSITLSTELIQQGDCTGDRLIGMLTELHNQPKPEYASENPNVLDKLKAAAKKINDQAYTDKIQGVPGNTLGWTFNVNTDASQEWSAYDVRLTTAVVMEDKDVNRVMKGKLPDSMPGAFVKLTVKPKK